MGDPPCKDKEKQSIGSASHNSDPIPITFYWDSFTLSKETAERNIQ